MNGPQWAQGCSECSMGLVTPPAIPQSALSVYTARRTQAANGELTFCECKAGQAMRRNLLGDGQAAERMPTFGGEVVT